MDEIAEKSVKTEPQIIPPESVSSFSLESNGHQKQSLEAFINKTDKFTAQFYGNVFQPDLYPTKINPHFFYGKPGQEFFGLWLKSTSSWGSVSGGISETDTLKEIGNSQEVAKILNFLAFAFQESASVYDWRERPPGFAVERLEGVGMEKGNVLGVRVSFENWIVPLTRILRSRDKQKIQEESIMLASEFIHERAHRQFDTIFSGGRPEAVSQGCQFLYASGENKLFESYLEKSLNNSEKILQGREEEVRRYSHYDVDNLAWMVFLWKQFSKRFPQDFGGLSQSGLENIEKLRKMIRKVAEIRARLGEEEWNKLRRELMDSLLNYSEDEGALVEDLAQSSADLGFAKLNGFRFQPLQRAL